MNKTQFGSSREDLSKRATVFSSGLFAGKTVVVTGAGGGLGLAIAALFARLGANLAINGRNEEKLALAREFLEGFGGEVFAVPMTIREPEQVEDFVRLFVGNPVARRGLHHPPGAVEIGVYDRIPALWTELQRSLRKLAPSIVHQNVNRPEFLVRPGDKILDLFRLPDGHGHSENLVKPLW